LDGGPPAFPRGFTCPAVLWIQPAIVGFRVRGSHPLWPAFPCRSPNLSSPPAVRTPSAPRAARASLQSTVNDEQLTYRAWRDVLNRPLCGHHNCQLSTVHCSLRFALRAERLVWPPPRSLATTCGISVDFFSSPYLDVSVRAVPHIWLFYSPYVGRVWPCRVSPFGDLRIWRLCAAPRSLSQLVTSFFGS